MARFRKQKQAQRDSAKCRNSDIAVRISKAESVLALKHERRSRNDFPNLDRSQSYLHHQRSYLNHQARGVEMDSIHGLSTNNPSLDLDIHGRALPLGSTA